MNFVHSLLPDNDRRNVEFFEVTGKTLVHPVTYHLQEFQKQIIYSAVLNNTLISLPPGEFFSVTSSNCFICIFSYSSDVMFHYITCSWFYFNWLLINYLLIRFGKIIHSGSNNIQL